MTNLDTTFLHYFGGMDNNSLRNVLKVDMDINHNDEMHSEPNIITHSSYYEFNDIANTLNNNKKYI